MLPGDFARLVLFETAESAEEKQTTCLGDQKLPCQSAFGDLLAGLFHFKNGLTAYSLDPEKWPELPLYADTSDNSYLNDVFWLVFYELQTWQNMNVFDVGSIQAMQELLDSEHPGVAESPAGGALKECMVVSKNLVAYIEALLVLCPYYKAGDPRIAGLADAQYSRRLTNLNTAPDEVFKAYMKRKLDEFYKTVGPVPPSGGACAEEGGEADQGANTGDGPGSGITAVAMSMD